MILSMTSSLLQALLRPEEDAVTGSVLPPTASPGLVTLHRNVQKPLCVCMQVLYVFIDLHVMLLYTSLYITYIYT